jgi:hypothetical protein
MKKYFEVGLIHEWINLGKRGQRKCYFDLVLEDVF